MGIKIFKTRLSIDLGLGTEYCCVTALENEKFSTIPNKRKNKTNPFCSLRILKSKSI